jgi:imidazole glycerol-phosphate synthase subunit HisF
VLKIRVIPTLLWKNVGLVKGISFDSWRRVGPVLPAIKVYNLRQVDEIILVDITATPEHREPDYEAVAEFTAECFIPITIGGGIRSIPHITGLLRAGADKVALNSVIFDYPSLLNEASNRFGSQCIVASIDVKKRPDGTYECYKYSGTIPTGCEVVTLVQSVEAAGAGEILLTSIERDGTMTGYDLGLIRLVRDAVNIPVIASGGAGSYLHMFEAIETGGASAVAAASIFHFTEQTPIEAKKYLAKQGVPVRLPVVFREGSG